MKRFLFFIALISVALLSQAAATYHLEKVTEIVDGGEYVFVDTTYKWALEAKNSSALPPEISYKSIDLDGLEEYVWTLKKVLYKETYYMTKATLKLKCSNGNFSFGESASDDGTEWNFEWQSDGTAKIYTTVSSTIKYIKKMEGSTNYNLGSTASTFTIYRLVPDVYERQVTSTHLGTICLPFAVDNYTGADVYELAYKELDGSGNPSQMYFQQVEGGLEAGHPYVFVPQAAGTISFTAVQGQYVSQPVTVDGFNGTFTGITNGTTLQGKYMINGASQIQKCGTGCTLDANRAYFDMDQVPTKNQVAAPTRQVMVIGQTSKPSFYDPSTTGLQSPNNASAAVRKVIRNGQLIILKDNQPYNTLGQQL